MMESYMTAMGFLWRHLRKVKYLFFGTIFVFFLSFAISRGSVWIGAKLVEFIAEADIRTLDVNKLVWLLGCLTIFTLASSFCLFLSHVFNAKLQPRFEANVSKDVFRYVMNHSIAFFSDEMSGLIISKINKADKRVKNVFDYVGGSVRVLTNFLVTIGIVAFIDLYLALFYFVMCALFAFITYKTRFKIRMEWSDVFKYEGVATGVMGDAINNASVVKSFSNSRFESLYFFKYLKDFLRRRFKVEMKNSWIMYSSNSLYDLLSLTFYFALFYTWYKTDLSVAGVVFVVSSISVLSTSVKEFSYVFSGIFRDWGELKEALEFVYQEHMVKDVRDAKDLKVKSADVVFDHIDYAYKGKKKLFKDFYLSLKNGEKVGLVGHSGSGKSTLIKLLVRYYDLNKGKIVIDGQDISQVRQDSLRKNVAIIPQDTTLFNRTILENIRYGNNKATDEEVVKAAKQAYCHKFISDLPNGYDSKVGEKGVMLSGGERQRIAIARAILQNAPILILDEATSALDSESEKYIQKALRELMKKKTVIAIAHRLSTLSEMDRIVVLEKGKIVEDGSQTKLLKSKGIFYSFYKMQSENFVKEA